MPNTDLSTLAGIVAAREELYKDLKAGKLTEQKANTMERVLRGQVMVKAQLPLQFLKLLSSINDPNAKAQLQATLREVSGFLGSGKTSRTRIISGSTAPVSIERTRGR